MQSIYFYLHHYQLYNVHGCIFNLHVHEQKESLDRLLFEEIDK